ncbi:MULTISPECIES: DNA polymerase ligase N-terminal domain-containing protein [Chitinophagaceae]
MKHRFLHVRKGSLKAIPLCPLSSTRKKETPTQRPNRSVAKALKGGNCVLWFKSTMRPTCTTTSVWRWAVPKGPSLNPADKRLAMMVEDHPYGYKDFEGTIPKGNYGAGTVIVWDEGAYTAIDGTEGKAAQEKSLVKQLKAGALKFELHGKKLKGEFALVRTKGMGDNAWLLIKHKDRYATETDITKKDKSVLSNKTVEKTGTPPDKIYGSKKQADSSKTAVKPKTKSRIKTGDTTEETNEEKADVSAIVKSAPAAPFPKDLSPMLATLVDEPFDGPDWEYVFKKIFAFDWHRKS